jgi:hypothetical protein
MRAMPAKPPRPADQMLTTVAATVTHAEAQRLRAIAEARQLPMTQLVRKALEQVYGTVNEPKAGGE